jgi:hypothetical protein
MSSLILRALASISCVLDRHDSAVRRLLSACLPLTVHIVLSCLVWLRMTALAAATTSLRTFCFTPAASRAITAQSTLGIVKCVKTGRPFPTCFTPFNTNDHLPRQARDRHKESTQKRPFFSQPFLTTVRTGKPSTQMEWRHVHNNIVIANYGACEQNAGFCAI